jgi:hypothetical protein
MYVRQNGQWVEVIVPGPPVVVSAGATSGTSILTAPTPFTVNPPDPNLGGYWNQATQEFAPPPGAYQINATLSCVSTNNSADATLLMMLNGVEFAQVTGGAAAGNVISCTLGLAIVTNAGDIITFNMLADRADMIVRTPGSGLSIIGRVLL